MSYFAGRLAGKEAAYFFQESKQAVNRLAEKSSTTVKNPPSASAALPVDSESQVDVLPEVMRHSLPSKLFAGKSPDPSSLSTASKWEIQSDPNAPFRASPDAINPLRAYVSLPQVTFGPKRWEVPTQGHSRSASTANELRRDRYERVPLSPEKLKAAAQGFQQIGAAFAAATAVVFGGAILMLTTTASKLDIQNTNDVRTKGRELVQPRMEMVKEHATPLKTWAENRSKKWQLEREGDFKEKPLVKELSKLYGPKKPS